MSFYRYTLLLNTKERLPSDVESQITTILHQYGVKIAPYTEPFQSSFFIARYFRQYGRSPQHATRIILEVSDKPFSLAEPINPPPVVSHPQELNP